jgi:hypothetical protein
MQQQYSDDDYDVTQNPDNTGFTGGLAKLDQQITQPAQPFDRSSFRDAINGAPNAYEVLDRYGLKADKSGRVTLPTGEIMDVVRGAGAGGTTGQWMGVGEMHNGQITTYAPQSQGSVAGTINGGNAAASGVQQVPSMDRCGMPFSLSFRRRNSPLTQTTLPSNRLLMPTGPKRPEGLMILAML